jgi:uncharacterized protein YkwD
VEIEQSAVVGHHQAMKEIQELKITLTQTKEITHVTVMNPDAGLYILAYQNPVTNAYVPSEKIAADASASTFAKAIQEYYQDTVGSAVSVTRIDLDAAGAPTLVAADIAGYRYEIEVLKLIEGVSTQQIVVAKVSTAAGITVKPPIDVQTSSPPLGGAFIVTCKDKDGQVSTTHEIPAQQSAKWAAFTISQQCHGLYNKIEGLECEPADLVPYGANGLCMRIRFKGINADPGQFEIKSGTIAPLTGTDVAVAFSTVLPYGTNLFYGPVPFEFLQTYEEKPQVIVSVDGEPAVCHNMTCDFTYVEAAGEVTAATFDPATKKLVITGTALPTLTPPPPGRRRRLQPEVAPVLPSHRRQLTASQTLPGYDVAQTDLDVLKAHNDVRTDPASFVPDLEAMKANFGGTDGKLYSPPGQTAIMTQEGVVPVDEAIAFLNAATALDALEWDQYLGFAAKDLAVAQGPTGETGHTSPAADGSTTMTSRIAKYGQFIGTVGENIAYGTEGGRKIVLQLIIDDGVPSRGHRTNIFKAEYKYLGAFTAAHTTYRTETVIDYAGGLTSNGDVALVANTAPATTTTTPTTTTTTTPAAPATCSNTIAGATNPGPKQSVVARIVFAHTDCIYDAAASSATSIECTLNAAPVCGTWKPEIYSALGLIPVASSFTDGIAVDCTVTQIAPSVDLNVLGYDNLTITGTNFPKDLASSTVDIELSSPGPPVLGPIKCQAQSSSSTQLICQTRPFGVGALDKTLDVKITINALVITQSLTVKIKAMNKDITSMVPATASPVLKTPVIFTIMSGFPFPINKEDFTVNMTLK